MTRGDDEGVAFLQWALPGLGLRWEGFRRPRGQVLKRIRRRRRELGLPDLAAYREYLEAHPEEQRHLESLCRVTISRFYRDRGVMERLRDDVSIARSPGACASSATTYATTPGPPAPSSSRPGTARSTAGSPDARSPSEPPL